MVLADYKKFSIFLTKIVKTKYSLLKGLIGLFRILFNFFKVNFNIILGLEVALLYVVYSVDGTTIYSRAGLGVLSRAEPLYISRSGLGCYLGASIYI